MDILEERIDLHRGPNGLGFNIRGGIDVPHLKNDHGIFVTKIRDNGTAFEDGRLKEGDKILEVNGLSLRKVTHSEAVQIFVKAGGNVILLVEHNAEIVLKKEMEDKKDTTYHTTNDEDKTSSISILTVIGLSCVVIGGAFLLNRYLKRPESSWASKWLSGE